METHAPKAVFLSYASQDAEAARRIAEALRPAGIEVWFDQEGGLEHGDEWDAKIRHQIKECVFFVAIISANTQARLEGYFRIEWELAAERAMGIAHGVPFILPIVIDETREPNALVPERFQKVQWMRLPGGNMTPEAHARFLKLWSHRTDALTPEAVKVRAGTGSDRSALPLRLPAKSAGDSDRGVVLPPASAAAAADQRGRKPGASDRMAHPRQRHPVLQTALGLAAAVALAGLGWLYFGGSAPEKPPVTAAQQHDPAPAEPARTGADNARGGLVVHTTPPGADVAVGGLTGKKSPATIEDVRPGRHLVIIRLSGCEDERIETEVKENEFVTINVTLTRSTGALQITSVPSWLEVDVKDRKAEVKEQMLKTPAKLEKLPTGDYELTFRREGWPDQKQTVLVKRNETVTAQAEFEAGALEITSVPSGAEVWRQGKRLGVTPVRQDGLVPGSYGLELRLKGYEAATRTGEVRAKQTTRMAIALDRIPTPEAGRVWKIPDLGLVMQPIPAGTFAMGDDRAAKAGRESMTPVTISRAFWLGRTEVTQREWLAIMEDNPSRFLGDDRPVERVPWELALNFCRRLTERERAAGRLPEGYRYTLPTEAQWEYACRAGTTGEFAGDVHAMGWYNANSGGETHPVGQKQANAWGLCDMHGNAMEWCLASQGGREGGGVTDASGPATDQSRAYHGGSFFTNAGACSSGFRRKDAANASMAIGFRLALNAGP